MSKTISTSWTCPACETIVDCEIKKPNALTATLSRTKCPECASTFMITFKKVPSAFEYRWTIIEYTLSKKGEQEYDLRHPPKTATKKLKRAKPAEQKEL